MLQGLGTLAIVVSSIHRKLPANASKKSEPLQ